MLDNNDTGAADTTSPKVLIAGAGLGGLFLGLLLEKAGTPITYHIYERAPTIKPLGALMTLSSNIMPLFKQTSLYEQLQEISLPVDTFTFYNGRDMGVIGDFVGENRLELVGYDFLVFARPRLYELLLKQIPPSKITFSQKIVSVSQDSKGVTIHTSDNKSHRGDILVGADGAYSNVRQSLYKSMDEQGILPTEDKTNMSKGYVCLVGTTEPLDPKKYPSLLEPKSRAILVLSNDSAYNWSVFTVPGNRMCWNAILQKTGADSDDDQNATWGPESSSKMCDEIRDFKTPYGTMGDLIDATPKDGVSQVYLEDKFFETWSHGRVVLIGDGAVNALQDAVILANCIHDLESTSPASISACFQDFEEQRHAHVKQQYETSQFTAKIMYGHTFYEKVLRVLIFSWLPKWMKRKGIVKDMEYQPQVNFLPLVKPQGTITPLPVKPSKKGMVEQKSTVAV
ncbi:hypothetical protein BG000_001024 [Podila horticola]|nr:hypothetical protein BG000_001024 [Podila horticola]